MKSLLLVLSFAVAPLLSHIAEARGIACMSGDLRCGGGGGGGGGGGPRPAPVAAAESNRLEDPKYQNRCTDFQSMTNEECAYSREDAYSLQKCINKAEYDFATKAGLGIACKRTASGYELRDACPCGCFDPKTKILVSDAGNWEEIEADKIQKNHEIASLSDNATLSNPDILARKVVYTTSGPESDKLYSFKLSNGKTLKVTKNHAILLADGRVLAAEKVLATDRLVSVDGELVEIESISMDIAPEVHNFLVESDTASGHLVVAEGVVVGDILWQNTLIKDLGRVLLRK